MFKGFHVIELESPDGQTLEPVAVVEEPGSAAEEGDFSGHGELVQSQQSGHSPLRDSGDVEAKDFIVHVSFFLVEAGGEGGV